MKGLVVNLIGGNYTVKNLETNKEVICKARGKLRYILVDENSSFAKNKYNTKSKIEKKHIKLSPKVGDIVEYDILEGINYINLIENRKNDLERPSISNIDQVLLIFSAKEPNFSFNLLDRFIIHIEKYFIDISIIVTKIDLLEEEELNSLKEKLNYYSDKLNYKIIFTSSDRLVGINEVKKIINNKVNVLAGQTGAGKSSLLNAINPSFSIKTQEISKSLGRGKHTTRNSTLHKVEDGYIADTPGFSSLDFVNISKEDLSTYYKDFVKLSSECKFRGCIHVNEPKCKVKEEIKHDESLNRRYEMYLKYIEQIENMKVKF